MAIPGADVNSVLAGDALAPGLAMRLQAAVDALFAKAVAAVECRRVEASAASHDQGDQVPG